MRYRYHNNFYSRLWEVGLDEGPGLKTCCWNVFFKLDGNFFFFCFLFLNDGNGIFLLLFYCYILVCAQIDTIYLLIWIDWMNDVKIEKMILFLLWFLICFLKFIWNKDVCIRCSFSLILLEKPKNWATLTHNNWNFYGR